MKAIDQVADQLNNTRAVCRKYYIHPLIFEEYLAGALTNGNDTSAGRKVSGSGLRPDEREVVRLLRKQLKASTSPRRSRRREASPAAARRRPAATRRRDLMVPDMTAAP